MTYTDQEIERRRAVMDRAIAEEEMPKALRPASRIRGTTEKLAAAVLKCREAVEAIEARRELTEEAKRERIEARREKLREQVDKIEAGAADELARATKAAQPPAAPSDPAEAMLLETRKGRAWQRTKQLLDQGQDPTEVAGRLAEMGDRIALSALAEELPAWRQATSHGENPGQAAEVTKTMLASIREAETPLLSDAEVTARDGLAAAERATSLLKTNAGLVRREADGIESAPLLLGEDHEGLDASVDLS